MAAGWKVACSVTWPLGQDALEAATLGADGVARLNVTIAANATATNSTPPRVAAASAEVALLVNQQTGMTVHVDMTRCSVPDFPGMFVQIGAQWQLPAVLV